MHTNMRDPKKPYWLTADRGWDTGPVRRSRPTYGDIVRQFYGMTCDIVLPKPGTDLIQLGNNIYEVLAPGTTIARNGKEIRIWRGLYLTRAVNSKSED